MIRFLEMATSADFFFLNDHYSVTNLTPDCSVPTHLPLQNSRLLQTNIYIISVFFSDYVYQF